MPFQRTSGSDPTESSIITVGRRRTLPGAVKTRGARREETPARSSTTSPVVYDDLLVELCSNRTGELSDDELAFLVSRPEEEVLAALMDLRRAGLVHYLERDLDQNVSDHEDRWAPADSLQRLRIKAWLDEAAFDLSDDIELSSSLAHGRTLSDPLTSWPAEARF